jgi:acyl-coenzyme A synthetase/AMP-(fatty) acid ligase
LISQWVTERLDSPAVVLPSGSVSFASFNTHIDNVAARLKAMNLPPGGRVAVLTPDDYAHWLLLLALDRLGMASVSLGHEPEALLAALKPDLVVTVPGSNLETGFRTLQATAGRGWRAFGSRSPTGFRATRWERSSG